MDKRHILVLGAGSVGKRHLNNFAELGCILSAMDPREDRLNEASKEVNLEMSFSNLEDALESVHSFDGVVIGSPPKFHVQQCVEFAKKGIPMLLEKPGTGINSSEMHNILERRLKRDVSVERLIRWGDLG